ncbi:MAG: serine hydroxymethyltransferase [Candidatus Aenigmarchaeota archaeon]|nr:serine hydroxymethyltransferase [Candidatus Aenigmarchaeota archaeon]NIP40553.1 serine hydroxymethyltransferase [Candidatus Aenigmarchaeota archaeon]NIQ18398.1 serine hydroxymethyltransferase [Candidatus Aenigmarchaeota archaeon]
MWRDELKDTDLEVFKAEENETRRINEGLELIPSENFPSRAVLKILGSVFNNKYAEGYPGKRYYGGSQFVDEIEVLAIERAKKLFGCEHVNVQPLSGSPANQAVYFAFMEYGDKLMGMSLAQGGHLTHGHKINFSGKSYQAIQYGVDRKTHMIDYDELRKLARKEKPKIIVSGATAYPREFDFKAFHEISEEVGAISLADIAHIAGLIVGGAHQSPFPFTDVVTTTTHKTLRGPRGGMIMCKAKYAEAIDRAVFPGLQGGPHEHVIAAKAVAFREAMKPEFRNYAKQIVKNAKTLADALLDHGFNLVTGGTDNHMILVDLRNKNITGKEAESALDRAGITANRNMIPYDSRKPFDPSGIRIGTPAVTTRGMKEGEMKEIGGLISKAIENSKNEGELKKIREEVLELCRNFPVY